MTEAAMTTTHDDPYRLRLAAIGLADSRVTRLETDLAACKKRHADALGKLTEAITGLMPKHEGDLPDDARGRLVDLYRATQAREEAESKKAAELSRIKAKLKKAEAWLTELIRARVEDRQIGLPLGDVGIAEGLGLTNETAAGVARAIAEVEAAGGTLSADERALRERLAAGGVVFSLDDDDGEEAADGDSDDEDEPQPTHSLAVVQ